MRHARNSCPIVCIVGVAISVGQRGLTWEMGIDLQILSLEKQNNKSTYYILVRQLKIERQVLDKMTKWAGFYGEIKKVRLMICFG